MADTLLAQAGEALAAGDFSRAFTLCKRLTVEGETPEIKATAFQNGGACLRRLGKPKDAIQFLQEGILSHPDAPGIHHNLGNALRDQGGKSRWQALHHYRIAEKCGLNTEDRAISHAHLWHDLGFPAQAYECICRWKRNSKNNHQKLRPELVQLILELATRLLEADDADPIASWCLTQLDGKGQKNAVNQLALAVSLCRMKRTDEAAEAYRSCISGSPSENDSTIRNNEFQQTLINASWNLACSFLKAGEMQAGWELFEYGLRAPAKGPQRWQRALPKIFSDSEVSLWRGQSLEGKKLLVIGEQAVGDTMMFLQLVPQLIAMGAELTLAIQDRLVPIYQRTYPALATVPIDTLTKTSPEGLAKLLPSSFDYQIPCGSVPQHCLRDWLEVGHREETLVADPELTSELRRRYREGLSEGMPVVGISWRGGGRSDRIRLKSLPIQEFEQILQGINARFISLQYGEAKPQVEHWKRSGIDVIYDDNIDALKDLDSWLSQVCACDYVISVANTTVHGAGGAGIPTLCLQSRHSDWRWVADLNHSYWYEAVETVFQDRRGSWQNAIRQTLDWSSSQGQSQKRSERSYSSLSFRNSLRLNVDAN